MVEQSSSITVSVVSDAIEVRGFSAPEDGKGWVGQALDEQRILLSHAGADLGVKGRPALQMSGDSFFLRSQLDGLADRSFSGVVVIDTGYGIKRIFFSSGAIVFAGSSVMDDRLGEVIYREGKISLDDWMASAAQVSKTQKFGQVLISSKIFSNDQLWHALRLQVSQIVRSVFMADRVYVEVMPGEGLAPTEVVFTESVHEMIAAAYSFGVSFRAFLVRLKAESEVVLIKSAEELQERYLQGTFFGDLISLIKTQSNVQEFINLSKLVPYNTIAALCSLVRQGACKIVPEGDEIRRNEAELASLRSKIDGYSYVLGAVVKAFMEGKKDFPIGDLKSLVSSLQPLSGSSLYVNEQGSLPKDSVLSMFAECVADREQKFFYMARIEAMLQFLLQIAGDNLDFKVAQGLRKDYRAVTS